MKNFLKQVCAQLASMLIAMGAAGLALFILLALAASSFRGAGEVEIKADSALVIDLSINIPDSPSQASAMEELQSNLTGSLTGTAPPEIHLRAVLTAIDEAAEDERINGILLVGSLRPANFGSGYGALREVRAALGRFRAAGKPVVAYLTNPTLRDYFLATAAEEIVLNPFGIVEVRGMAVSQIYFAGALEKFGVGIQVLKSGRYKSAVESFTRDSMSEEDREQNEALLGSLWGDLVETLAKARGIDPAELRRLAQEAGVFQAQEALAHRLVDRVAYLDVVREEFIERGAYDENKESFNQVALADYVDRDAVASALEDLTLEGVDKLAIVYAEGEIVDGAGSDNQVGGAKLARRLRKLRVDPSVKAVVLRVNSPGGSAFASEEIERELHLVREKGKPVVVSMGSYAASGGYWIASGADAIVADPTTITGSIGVFGLLPNYQRLANDFGVTFDGAKTAPLADIQSPYRPKTEAEMAVFQGFVDNIYDTFLKKVAGGREMELEAVKTIAEGRVWSGADAHRVGLVDRLGGLSNALAEARALSGLPDDCAVIEVPRRKAPKQLYEFILEQERRGSSPSVGADPLKAALRKVEADLRGLGALGDPRGIYARLPFGFRLR